LILSSHGGITREYPANEQKRIDLMIDTETFTIGIEKKIYHWEANDFENYASVINALGNNKTALKAVLCLRTLPNETQPRGGFIRHTYADLWKHVRSLLGHHLLSASPKWITFLTELLTTPARLSGETPDEREVTEFFMKNHELIDQLVNDRQQLLNRMAARLRSIEGQVKEAPEFAKYRKARGLCGTSILASHFEIQARTIGMDLAVDMTGWKLQLWDNGPAPYDILHRLADSKPMQERFPQITLDGNFKILQQWDLHVDEMQLLQAVTSGYAALIDAGDSLMFRSE
jgi:hypothetical protein